MDPAVRAYIKAIPASHRPLFDRLHGLILALHPDVDMAISYAVVRHRTSKGDVFLGIWKGGVSLHAVDSALIEEFKARHPKIKTGKGSLNFKVTDEFTDAEVRKVIRRRLG